VQPFAFVVKQYREAQQAKALHRNLTALDRHVSARRGSLDGIRLPRPVAFDQGTGVVVMEELPGKDLMRALGEVDLSRTMWEAGEMLGSLHQSPRVVREHVSVREKLNDVRQAAGRIERLFGTRLPRLINCLARCLSVGWTDDMPEVLLHGAFRPKHVFVHDGRLALIDVDGLRVGHPAHDIGHFLSALYYMEAQELLSAADRHTATRRFLEGYSAHTPWRLSPAAVLWCTAALLVHKQARKYVVHLHEDREEKVDRVLKLAEKALAACENCGAASLDVIWSVLC
jgi:aminoglycoside phosphotransferase (APT) family kinase protein